MHAFDTDLLPRCVELTLSHSRAVEDEVILELQTSARTPLVKALQMLRLQRAIFATGMFSLFESALQSHTGWDQPFKRLKKNLNQSGRMGLAETFNDYLWKFYNEIRGLQCQIFGQSIIGSRGALLPIRKSRLSLHSARLLEMNPRRQS